MIKTLGKTTYRQSPGVATELKVFPFVGQFRLFLQVFGTVLMQ